MQSLSVILSIRVTIVTAVRTDVPMSANGTMMAPLCGVSKVYEPSGLMITYTMVGGRRNSGSEIPPFLRTKRW